MSSKKSKRKNESSTPIGVRINASASPRKEERKKYPKSARHAKTNTNTPNTSKRRGGNDEVHTFPNIKPSSTRTSKYRNEAKRNRSKTQGNVLKDKDDEKHFFATNSNGPIRGMSIWLI